MFNGWSLIVDVSHTWKSFTAHITKMVDSHHKAINQRFVFSELDVLEEHCPSSAGSAAALASYLHRCRHLPKNNKKSFSHLVTLKHNLAPKNLQGCPTLTFYRSWCQWSIQLEKLPLDLPGLRHKDKWCYQIKCLLMTFRKTKCWFHEKPYVYLCSYHSKWSSFVTSMWTVKAKPLAAMKRKMSGL